MNYFKLRLGLDASSQQPEILQLLKTEGAEAIQVSDGLYVKTKLDEAKLMTVLREKKLDSGVSLERQDKKSGGELPRDIQAFMGILKSA